MRSLIKQTGLILLLAVSLSVFSQDYHVRIGFVGNSITAGTGLPNATVDAYPSQIGVLLKQKYGDTCIITNYAVSGRTMLKHGDFPIWKEPLFQTGWNYAPDICFIMLGTNDSKPYNWDVYGDEFFADYMSMIDTFKLRNPRTKFILCRPDPAFGIVFDIRDSVIKNYVIPQVDSIAKITGAVLIDFYNGMLDSASLFSDKIHPNQRGAKAMAKIAYDKIVESDIIHQVDKGYTFATSLKSSVSSELRQKDSATLSWTTLNATHAYLNGQEVALNGSLKVAPDNTTKYILKATGSLSTDSLVLEQKVYTPILTKVNTFLSSSEIHKGDTVVINLQYLDQKSKSITNTVYDINWSVAEGYGRFINKGDNKTSFIADSMGSVKVNMVINDVTYSKTFTVIEKLNTSISSKFNSKLQIFPNPIGDFANLTLTITEPTIVTVRVADLSGRICLTHSQKLSSFGQQTVMLNTSKLNKGNYVITVEYQGNQDSYKILKK